jgi:hypothetical protein
MVNGYFDSVKYEGDFYFYLFELANFSVLAFFLIILYKLQYLSVNSLIVWTGIFFSPFLFNYFLFSPLLFPDQFQYAGEVMSLKSTGESIQNIQAEIVANNNSLAAFSFVPGSMHTVNFSAGILGWAPIPNYMTVTSLAFANKFFLFLLFLWLRKFFSNENHLLLLFLVPSLVLYSSLSLRDNLVIIFSVLFLLQMLRGRYIISLFLLYPLLHLKIQMFAFLSIYYVGRLIFQAHKSYIGFGILILALLSAAILLDDAVLLTLNSYRYGFAAENLDLGNGLTNYAAWGLYGAEIQDSLTMHSIPEVIYLSLLGLPKLLLVPLPWNWTTVFYPLQSLESVGIVVLFSWVVIKNNLIRNQEFLFLLFVLICALMVYSLLLFNVGTFVRYRFTLVYPFLLATFFIAEHLQSLEKK